MNSWIVGERFDEESLLDKKYFYSELNNEDISDKDCKHYQKVWKVFKIKHLGEDHDLYVQSDTLLLVDVFENLRDKCIEICELDPAHFLSVPGLAWQACFKKTRVELELLTGIDMLLMTEKRIRGRMCEAVCRYAKANNRYMKNYGKSIILLYLMYLEASNLYGWAMSQKLPVDGFKWINELSKLDENFMKNYDKNSNKRYFLEVDVEYPKKLFNLHKDFSYLPERKEIKKSKKLICNIRDEKNMLFT